METEFILTLILTVLGSNGLWQFLNSIFKKHSKESQKVDGLVNKIDALSNRFEESQAIQARTHILNFSDELQNDITHSQEYFRQIMSDIKNYELYCTNHPNFENGFTNAAVQYITDTYNALLRQQQFHRREDHE